MLKSFKIQKTKSIQILKTVKPKTNKHKNMVPFFGYFLKTSTQQLTSSDLFLYV